MSERRERPWDLTARCNVFCSNKLPAVNIISGVMSTLQIVQTARDSVDSNYHPFKCIGAHLVPNSFCDLAMFWITFCVAQAIRSSIQLSCYYVSLSLTIDIGEVLLKVPRLAQLHDMKKASKSITRKLNCKLASSFLDAPMMYVVLPG